MSSVSDFSSFYGHVTISYITLMMSFLSNSGVVSVIAKYRRQTLAYLISF